MSIEDIKATMSPFQAARLIYEFAPKLEIIVHGGILRDVRDASGSLRVGEISQ